MGRNCKNIERYCKKEKAPDRMLFLFCYEPDYFFAFLEALAGAFVGFTAFATSFLGAVTSTSFLAGFSAFSFEAEMIEEYAVFESCALRCSIFA